MEKEQVCNPLSLSLSDSISFVRLLVVHRLYGGSSTDQPSGDRGGDAKNPREFA